MAESRKAEKDTTMAQSDDKISQNLQSTATNSFVMTETVQKFSGDDMTFSSTKWAQDIEDNAEIFGWTPQQKLIIARRSLSGTAELWMKSEKIFKTYEELKTALQKEFPDAINSKQMHELMSTRKKRANETFYQYMLTMKELGRRAKFPDYISIQYIIDGITDYEVNKACLYGITTYSALKEKLVHYEAMKRKMSQQQIKQQRTEKPRILNPIRQKETADVYIKNSDQRCYKCGEKGHVSSACVNGLKCFRCNSYGHIGSQCHNVTSRGASGVNTKLQQSMFVQKSTEGAAGVNVNDDRVDRVNDEKFNMEECARCSQRSLQGRNEIADNLFTQNECPEQFTQNDVILNVNNDYMLNKSVINVKIGGFTVKCLLDTGSDLNLISSKLFSGLNIKKYEPHQTTLTGLGLFEVCSVGKCNIDFSINEFSFNSCFTIVPEKVIPYLLILGQPFLESTTIVIHKGNLDIRPLFFQLPANTECNDVSPAVQQLIDNYKPNKVKEAPIKMKIVLKDDVPVVQRPRRLAIKEEEVVRNQIKEWLDNGIIRPSHSEYASPLVLVKKKDGSTRVCIDYRKVNQKMVKDEYPLPVIEDHIDKLCKARVFSTLDLKNGFFHLPIEEESIKYTAFVTSSPEGQYEFLRAPFGLSICPKYFMRYINIIFRDLIARGIVLIFIDDVIILAEDEHQALARLKEVLRVASDNGLEINWKKTQLLQRSVEYLGHVVSNGSVRPSPDKTEAVRKFPTPRNLKEVHSFIGLTSYFRKFIPNYALIARPLSDMLKKGDFHFSEEQRLAFEELKEKLCCDPVLKIFDPQMETELHADACKYGYAAILMQKDPNDGSLHPVHYMSRKTNEAQQNCSSYELEALAVVEGVKKFRKYLIGIPFKIITDCEAFQKTLMKKDVSAKVARWVMFLQDFEYTIVHRKGDKMQHVDSLSRNVLFVNTELHARIKKAQEEDEELKILREILQEKTYKDYYLENGIVYRGLEKKLVLPELMDLEIIRRTHGVGHFGKKKIKDIIEKDYYIKGLDSKIEKVISSCVPCILASRKLGKKEGFLNPIDKGDLPLETLHCDHLGPFDTTKKMYNYILTVIDAYTKFVWIYPVKSLTSKETVEKLKLHQKDFGNPSRIITDRGTAFTGAEFQEYCQEEDIQHIKIATGIPRGNGQVERMNQIIISVLSKMCIEEPAHWYKYVSKLQRIINSSYQRSIGTSPFELMTGTKIKQKEDIKIVELLEEENRKDFIEKREQLRKEAKAQILKIQEENRGTFNKRRKGAHIYKEGDLVAIQRTQFGNALKLKQKFFGPYKVLKEIGRDRYEVEKIDNGKEGPKKTTTGVDFMKRWL